MNHIYCISGFGADERVFSKIRLIDYELHFIPWLTPVRKESLENYASRMSDQIPHDNPILLGLSFGGMMCIEIAKIRLTKAVILVSSIKTYKELPLWMRGAGFLRLSELLPLRSLKFKLLEPLENFNLGIITAEEKKLASEYRKNIDPNYTNWAIGIILAWRNTWLPKRIYHIHGTKDRIFPIKNIKADYIIPSGGHMMIMNMAVEVNFILNKILAGL